MKIPFISYLITCKNEGSQIESLLHRLFKYKDGNECIILDDYSDDASTIEILNNTVSSGAGFFQLHRHALENNYSAHKNYGKSLCKGQYIFQIDADEVPSEFLLENIKDILTLNSDIDLFWIPRINNFRGVTDIEAKKWGWQLTKMPELIQEKIIDDQSYEYEFLKKNGYILEEIKMHYGKIKIKFNPPIVNVPDPQGRLFKNLPHLLWKRRLHEKIEGYKSFTHLPYEFDYALHHNKTIEKQIQTNIKYNQKFTEEENQGFKI